MWISFYLFEGDILEGFDCLGRDGMGELRLRLLEFLNLELLDIFKFVKWRFLFVLVLVGEIMVFKWYLVCGCICYSCFICDFFFERFFFVLLFILSVWNFIVFVMFCFFVVLWLNEGVFLVLELLVIDL